MRCETARELIATLVIDGLSDEERRELEDHVAGCAACAEELRALEKLWTDLGVVAAPEPTDEAKARLADAIRAFAAKEANDTARRRTEPGRAGPRRLLQLAASILIFATGAAAGLAWSSLETEEPSHPAPADPTFLVLMRGKADTPAADAALGQWTAQLSTDQLLVGGAQIAETDGAWYGPAPEPFHVQGLFELFGYMIITARDLEHAREIARSSPHIGQTGAVEIWPIG